MVGCDGENQKEQPSLQPPFLSVDANAALQWGICLTFLLTIRPSIYLSTQPTSYLMLLDAATDDDDDDDVLEAD